MPYDLAIRGGTVEDGTGAPPYRADIGVSAGRVTGIASSLRGDVELDATNALLCPGFPDLHTHYDPQVPWDP